MVASAIAKKMLKKNATGRTSSAATEAGDKPLSMSVYRSMTDKQRADEKSDAFKAYDKDKITYKEYKTIVDRVDSANAAESQRMTTKMQQGKADKAAPPPTLREALAPSKSEGPPAAKNPRDMSAEELAAKIKEQEAKAKPKMKKGGMPKKKKPTSNYAYGGMTTSKPRTGNTDYRKGGMFMKKGKK